MSITNQEQEKLFTQFRHLMGAPIRQIEIDDIQLCTALDFAIDRYSQYVQEFLIENQWQSLYGQNITTTDMAFALSVRSLDYVNQSTYAYSKQVGLQSNGPWELKKDYVEIESGRQVYQIPAGREVNEVLWITPPTINKALLTNFGGINYGFGGGFAQTSGGGGTGQGAGYYIAPAFDTLLTASDMNLKNRMIRSDLVYKITAGPNGTKLLHLLSTPTSNFSFGLGTGSGVNMTGCQVWYFYYDTTPENLNDCLKDNPDIIKIPNQVPLSKLDYSDFNEPTKVVIRQLFMAYAKKTLSHNRGKFGGIVGPPEAERTLDYERLFTEGNEEITSTLERLDARLARLSSTAMLERSAGEAENLNRAKKFSPNKWTII